MLEFAQGHELMKEAEALRSQLGWEVDKFEQSDGALPYDSPTPMESSRTTIGATTTTSILQPSDEVKQSALDNNLRVAAEEGNLVSVELLLRRGANPNAGTEVAVLKGHKRVLEVLFDKGAEPNLDAHTWKLLKLFKCWDMIEVLLLRGANPPSRESLMFHAASASQQSIVEILLRHTNPVMAITGAAIEGDEEAVKRILQSNRDTYQGVESEKRAPTIWTELRKVALEKAARFGHVEVVKLLLEEGADPNDGFENAASHGNIEILKLLLERGADTKGDQVGIFFAALWGDKPSVELLVESGASIDAGLAGSIEGKNGEIATYLDQLGAILPSAARGVELHAPTLEELKMERYLVEALADRKEDLKYYGLSILSDIQISEYVTQNHRSSVCLGIYGPKANTRVIVKLRHAIPGSHPLDSLKWEVQRLNEVWTLQKAHGLGLAVVKMLGYANDGTDLVFEYIEGGTLRTAICNKDPRLEDRDNLLSILKQVLNVIFELQSLNVAHGDISVDNVMFRNAGLDVCIIDFELAQCLEDETRLVWKPPNYPTDEISSKTDIYGIGCMVHDIVCQVGIRPNTDYSPANLPSVHFLSKLATRCLRVYEDKDNPVTLADIGRFIESMEALK